MQHNRIEYSMIFNIRRQVCDNWYPTSKSTQNHKTLSKLLKSTVSSGIVGNLLLLYIACWESHVKNCLENNYLKKWHIKISSTHLLKLKWCIGYWQTKHHQSYFYNQKFFSLSKLGWTKSNMIIKTLLKKIHQLKNVKYNFISP